MASGSDCMSQNKSKSLERNLNWTLSISRSENIVFENSTCLNENITIFDTTENLNDEYDITPLEENDPTKLLKNMKDTNVDPIIIAHLNINSIRNKFDALKTMIAGNIDIFLISETKLDESFPPSQFTVTGYRPPFHLDRTADGGGGGGVVIYVRDDIPCKRLNSHKNTGNFECIFFELRLGKIRENIVNFLDYVSTTLDHYIGKYFSYGWFKFRNNWYRINGILWNIQLRKSYKTNRPASKNP